MNEANQNILIIDDEVVQATSIAMQLEADYNISLNHDGQNIVDLVIKQKPDLILLDIMLPDISGYDICEILKEHPDTHHVPIIFLTGLEDSYNEQTGLDLGAHDYISKPISVGILKARILRILQANLYIEFLERLLGEKDVALATLQQEAALLLGQKPH